MVGEVKIVLSDFISRFSGINKTVPSMHGVKLKIEASSIRGFSYAKNMKLTQRFPEVLNSKEQARLSRWWNHTVVLAQALKQMVKGCFFVRRRTVIALPSPRAVCVCVDVAELCVSKVNSGVVC